MVDQGCLRKFINSYLIPAAVICKAMKTSLLFRFLMQVPCVIPQASRYRNCRQPIRLNAHLEATIGWPLDDLQKMMNNVLHLPEGWFLPMQWLIVFLTSTNCVSLYPFEKGSAVLKGRGCKVKEGLLQKEVKNIAAIKWEWLLGQPCANSARNVGILLSTMKSIKEETSVGLEKDSRKQARRALLRIN